jgi:hypothetical protein
MMKVVNRTDTPLLTFLSSCCASMSVSPASNSRPFSISHDQGPWKRFDVISCNMEITSRCHRKLQGGHSEAQGDQRRMHPPAHLTLALHRLPLLQTHPIGAFARHPRAGVASSLALLRFSSFV